MKTFKKISVIALVLMISASVANANQIGSNQLAKVSTHGLVKYIVKIHAATYVQQDKYLLEIVDGSGREVAPPQEIISGVTSYTIIERSALPGLKFAKIVTLTDPHPVYAPTQNMSDDRGRFKNIHSVKAPSTFMSDDRGGLKDVRSVKAPSQNMSDDSNIFSNPGETDPPYIIFFQKVEEGGISQ